MGSITEVCLPPGISLRIPLWQLGKKENNGVSMYNMPPV
jgi:hypothetical protein